MGEEKNTDFGFIGGALERTKAYHNSNTLDRYKGILLPNTQKTLKEFSKEHGFETGNDTDTMEDDKLLKYTVHKMIPTKRLEEFEDPTQIYLITDASGRDIGTYDKSTGKFTLSPDIVKSNQEILEKIPGGEALAKEFKEPSLKDITEKLSKGETIVLTPEKATLMVKQKELAKSGQDFALDDTEEEKAMANIPEGAKPLVAQIKEKLPGVQIKEILIVSSPETLEDDLGKDSGVKSNGGPVIMVRAVNKEGLGGMDDVYMFQDDTEIPNAGQNKGTILDVMSQHKDEGVVDDFRDHEKDHIIEEAEKQAYLTESKVENLKAANFSSEEERAAAIRKEYEELGQFIDDEIDYHDKEENEDLKKFDAQMDENIEEKIQETEEMASTGETNDSDDDYTIFSKYENGRGARFQ